MTILERQIENGMRINIEKMGGKFLKWVSPGNDGVPDRIAIFPNGSIWFVELKAENGRVAPLQEYWKKELTKLNCNAVIIRGKDEAIRWCAERGVEIDTWKELQQIGV